MTYIRMSEHATITRLTEAAIHSASVSVDIGSTFDSPLSDVFDRYSISVMSRPAYRPQRVICGMPSYRSSEMATACMSLVVLPWNLIL